MSFLVEFYETSQKQKRTPKEEIERLVKEAEKFKADDDKVKAKIEAKNQLEQYAYQVRNAMNEEKLKDKFSEDEKKKINEKADEILKWSNENPQAAKEEYDAKVKELEAIFNPIMQRIYQSMGGMPGGPGGMPNMGGFPGGAGGFPGGAGGFPGGAGPQPGAQSGTSTGGAEDVE